MEALRKLGIWVELDDFGTGYASLSHLSSLAVNGLKVDRSFIRRMTQDPKQSGIVSALISMTKLMNLHVVCEGVETWDQIKILREFENCSVQGFLVSKPMPTDRFMDWMTEWAGNNTLRSMARKKLFKNVGITLSAPL